MKQSVFIFLSILIFQISAFGFTGARHLGMGSAYVAVEELSQNPAVMVFLPNQEIRLTSSLNRKYLNPYDKDFSCGLKVDEQASIGVSYLSSMGSEINDDIYSVSLGKKINDSISLGGSIKFYREYLQGELGQTTGLDLGLYIKSSPKVSWGLILQDVNQPETLFSSGTAKHRLNLRGGYAYRPDEKTILAVDLNIYDPLDIVSFPKLSIGLENKVNERFILRMGWNQLPVTPFKNAAQDYSIGFGTKFFDKFFLDYALLYVPDFSIPYDTFFHYLSVGVVF